MSKEQPLQLDQRTQNAITELQNTISSKYPTATFEVERAAEDPAIIHLVTTVDVDDPDEVGDLVLDRVLDLVAEERIPVHVIPVRTPERIRAALEAQARTQHPSRRRSIPLFGQLP